MQFNTKIMVTKNIEKNNSAEQEKTSTQNLRRFGLGFVAVIILSIFYPFFRDNLSRYDEDPVKNNELDASVYQVEQYLKNNLRDPDSYAPIEWSAVQKTEDGYSVRHKYWARNGLGRMAIENRIFYLNKNGNITGYTDY